jgi:pseudouridine-5'-phosphate glycosidase
MLPPQLLHIHREVADAQAAGRPVVALESTLIAHGLPRPLNLETARAAETIVRQQGAIPATIAVLDGRPTVGLTAEQLERLASGTDIRKASTRDLASAIAQRATAATTVAATMFLAHHAAIRVFATGGIGGVHPPATPGGPTWDVSADLDELARTPVAVVCAGAKSILDLPATLEVLESVGVPVVGYQTSTFPAFYLHDSGLPVSARIDSPAAAASLLAAHWALGGAGVVIGLPLSPELSLDPAEFATAWQRAEEMARSQDVRGPARTPFLLARLAELTEGRSLRANRELITANANLAARIAVALATEGR